MDNVKLINGAMAQIIWSGKLYDKQYYGIGLKNPTREAATNFINRGYENGHNGVSFPIRDFKTSKIVPFDAIVERYCRFRLGDRVELPRAHHKSGVIRYIGAIKELLDTADAHKEMIGIELDTWSANAGDGSINGTFYFKTSAGRGYFTNHEALAYIVRAKIEPGCYARLKGLNRIPKFNGKTVKVVSFVEKKGRWKVKLLHAKQEKKYLGVREDNLDHISDWEPSKEYKDPDCQPPLVQHIISQISIGDRVKTQDGKYGTVKYIGTVDFSSDHRSYFGLELEKWDINGNNGIVKGRKYFNVSPGRGYFVRDKGIVQIL